MNINQELYHIFKEGLQYSFHEREISQMWRAVKEDLLVPPPGYPKDGEAGDWRKTVVLSALEELKAGCPIQYVTGICYFMGIRLKCDARALIPRPETEELTHWAITDMKKSAPRNCKVLDVGTGSGCIPVSIKKNMAEAEVWGIDICAEALDLARQNAREHRLEITFQKLDIFEYKKNTLGKKQWDVLLSNPPYIPFNERHLMDRSVIEYEPHVALFVDNDVPLRFYQTLCAYAKAHLVPGGKAYMECNTYHAASVAQLFKKAGFSDVQLREDLQGNVRMLRAIR